jgi:hypothetical protein
MAAVGCLLLTLQAGREQQYWADAGTLRHLRRLDILGLAAGVIIDLVHAYFTMRLLTPRVRSFVTVLLQLAQLAWVVLGQESYMRHRTLANTVQRLRGLAFTLTWMRHSTTKAFMEGLHFERPVQTGTLGTFLTVSVMLPM